MTLSDVLPLYVTVRRPTLKALVMNCLAGEYQDQPGASNCKRCVVGLYQERNCTGVAA